MDDAQLGGDPGRLTKLGGQRLQRLGAVGGTGGDPGLALGPGLERLVERIGCGVARVREPSPTLIDRRQARSPVGRKRLVAEHHPGIAEHLREGAVDRGTQIRRTERRELLAGIDPVTVAQQREQVPGVIGSGRCRGVLHDLARQDRRHGLGGVGVVGHRVAVPDRRIRQAGEVGEALLGDGAVGPEERGGRQLVEDDHHDVVGSPDLDVLDRGGIGLADQGPGRGHEEQPTEHQDRHRGVAHGLDHPGPAAVGHQDQHDGAERDGQVPRGRFAEDPASDREAEQARSRRQQDRAHHLRRGCRQSARQGHHRDGDERHGQQHDGQEGQDPGVGGVGGDEEGGIAAE